MSSCSIRPKWTSVENKENSIGPEHKSQVCFNLGCFKDTNLPQDLLLSDGTEEPHGWHCPRHTALLFITFWVITESHEVKGLFHHARAQRGITIWEDGSRWLIQMNVNHTGRQDYSFITNLTCKQVPEDLARVHTWAQRFWGRHGSLHFYQDTPRHHQGAPSTSREWQRGEQKGCSEITG